MRMRTFSLLVAMTLLWLGFLGCYKGFCPDCAESTPVLRLGYPASSTFTVGQAIAALAPDPQGGQPQSYAVVNGSLPPGLSLNGTTGLITGSATTPGRYLATIQAGNLGGAVTEDVAFTELPAPSADSLVASSPNPLYGATVTLAPTFSGGTATLGTAGPGSADLAASVTSGTPVTTGPLTAQVVYTLTVTNAAGVTATTSVTVSPQTVVLLALTPGTVNLTVGHAQTFSTTVSGALNPGLAWSVDGAAGGNSMVGTITSAGVYTAGTVLGVHTVTATAVATTLVGQVASGPAGSRAWSGAVAASQAVSKSAVVTVYPPPVAASLTAAAVTITSGKGTTLRPIFSNGTGVITYTGPKSSGTLAASLTSGTAVSTGTLSDVGAYSFTLTVTNAAQDSASTNPGTVVIVVAAPVATSLTASAATISANKGTTLTPLFSNGTAVITYTGPKASGTLAASLTSGTAVSTGTLSDVGAYSFTLTVTNAAQDSVSTSPGTTVTVVPEATASLAASTLSPTYGQTTVTVTPTFTGATSALLGTSQGGSDLSTNPVSGTPIPVQASGFKAATTYWLRATNAAGDEVDTSLFLAPLPAIQTQPLGMNLAVTQTATFSVAAAGQNPPFTYQWYGNQGNAGSALTPITGATSPFYTTPAMATTDGGSTYKYYVTVKDAQLGTTSTSDTVTLQVGTQPVPPTLTIQPAGQAAASGASVTFNVTATSPTPATYQWYQLKTPPPTAIPSGTDPSYAFLADLAQDGEAYEVKVTNDQGQAASLPAPLTVTGGSSLVLTSQPANQYVDAQGGTATFAVTASDPNATYQWHTLSAGSSTTTPVAGATGATFTTTATSTTFYNCVVTDGGSSVTSDAVGLFVGPPGSPGDLSAGTLFRNAGQVTPPTLTLSTGAASEVTNLWWPELIATDNLTVTFTLTVATQPAGTPAAGWSLILGDPSRNVTPGSYAAPGTAMGAYGLAGLVLVFGTTSDYDQTPVTVPFLAAGRGEAWGSPWNLTSTSLGTWGITSYPGALTVAQAANGQHRYQVNLFNGMLTVLLDGAQVFSGQVRVPPVAYVGFGASTEGGGSTQTLSDLNFNVSAP